MTQRRRPFRKAPVKRLQPRAKPIKVALKRQLGRRR